MTNSSNLLPETRSEEIEQAIASFQRRFTEAHVYLAYHAALPIALTPHLTYCLWANFQMDIANQDLNVPWIAVADLLLSPLCQEVGYELYEMNADLRNYLLEQMINHPSFGHKRVEELAHFLLSYVERELNDSKLSTQTLAQAQRWTALAYVYPEAVAHDLANKLAELTLREKTEWLRMTSLTEAIATPLRQAHFESLLAYLQGMRELARGNHAQAESTLKSLPTHNNQIVVAGVTLPIPELQDSDWQINPIASRTTSLRSFQFETAKLIPQPRFMRLGSRWVIERHQQQGILFDERLERQINLEMVRIPDGSYWMGTANDEGDYRQRPQHRVTIASFFLSRFPVTQAQWRAISKTTKVRIELNSDPSYFQGDNLPVEHITWFEAIEFCERLQLQTGKPYRLPSEAEWEYACRAGTETPFYFGETISPQLASYDASKRYGSGPKGRESKQTTEVGSHNAANNFGLDEMHGNVWEWCADHWYEDYINAPEDGSVRITNNRAAPRVIRGGSWINEPNICRCAYRNGVPPSNKVLTIGFRVAVSLHKSNLK
ncbi:MULTISPECIES: formylglycine-generating enzyme family protein [Nostoc]|uniref:Formylglycine-generating enzyme family protein n=1 Tax=Nostoc paludosum FACHB-159 TaxID=2692908 RepID=A0ABR8K753_9NOSO|nr:MULTISPECIES: formylglycine-generating enzyme family protein [Nostoc]MBD2677506.1 formylglycine-generating enzyme family protein [Nostoc sp. FACHB-857]MBD2734100.1 formylglycine-generating enzyme family protein [Nostoc paludosum FACHB-159]